MDEKDPTSVIKMIQDLRSGSESYRKSSSSMSLRLSGTAYTASAFADHDGCTISPKRPRLDDSSNSTLNKSETDIVPGSPWEWRRLKGEVIGFVNVTCPYLIIECIGIHSCLSD